MIAAPVSCGIPNRNQFSADSSVSVCDVSRQEKPHLLVDYGSYAATKKPLMSEDLTG